MTAVCAAAWLAVSALASARPSASASARPAPPSPAVAPAVTAPGGSPAQGWLLDRIVAVVDAQTVTQAELVAEARLALARRAARPEDAGLVALDAQLLHDVLSYLIGQMLVAREARRVGAQDAADAEVEAAYEAFCASFTAPQGLETWFAATHLSAAGVRDVLRRELTVERYLGQRLRTRLAGLGERPSTLHTSRAAELRAFLPAYLTELRQTVEVRRLRSDGALERESRP